MSHYQYVPEFLFKKEADYLYKRLLEETPWTQVRYYKPERGYVVTPRLTWVAGFHQKDLYPLDTGFNVYSPNEIPKWLLELKDVVEDYLNTTYNFILFAQYRDENDSISYHSDDEKFLGYNPNIASITVGQPRPFCLKNKATKETQEFNLGHGDLFVMKNNCQRDYMHSVPKQSKSLKPRISITFRKALNESGSANYYKYNTMNSVF
jgi:alkylated DNA repair dioxygenase AlkB